MCIDAADVVGFMLVAMTGVAVVSLLYMLPADVSPQEFREI